MTVTMKNDSIKKVLKQIESLPPSELAEVRDKLIPLFLTLEKKEPYKDKKVIRLVKKRYLIALKEHKQGKLIDAELHLRKSIG